MEKDEAMRVEQKEQVNWRASRASSAAVQRASSAAVQRASSAAVQQQCSSAMWYSGAHLELVKRHKLDRGLRRYLDHIRGVAPEK